MATILELAKLSEVLYGDSPIPSGWTEVGRSEKPDGYLGIAYVNANKANREIVIVNRGTRVHHDFSLSDIEADAELMVGEKTNQQQDKRVSLHADV